MHIPVHDEHLLQTPGLGMLRGYGHVVEDAKAHAAVGHGMVAGRPHQSKGAVKTVHYGVHRRHGSARRHHGRVIGVLERMVSISR